MSGDLQRLLAGLRKIGISEPILERVERLNPAFQEGERARGIHRKPSALSIGFARGYVSKGQFCREHDPILWRLIPRGCIVKHGKREFLSWEAYRDHVWLMPISARERRQRPQKIKGWW